MLKPSFSVRAFGRTANLYRWLLNGKGGWMVCKSLPFQIRSCKPLAAATDFSTKPTRKTQHCSCKYTHCFLHQQPEITQQKNNLRVLLTQISGAGCAGHLATLSYFGLTVVNCSSVPPQPPPPPNTHLSLDGNRWFFLYCDNRSIPFC